VRQALGEVALAAHLLRHVRGERLQLLQRLHPEVADPLDQRVQHVHGGAGVVQRPVGGRRAGPEHPGERAEPAVRRLVAGQDPARQPRGVHHGEGRPADPEPVRRRAQEAGVERRVVRHQHAPGRELQERRQHLLDLRGADQHRLGDAGQDRDERRQPAPRVDQRGELAEHLAAPDLDRADLGDRIVAGRPARGLQIDDHERDAAQRGAQLVDGALRPTGRGCPAGR